MHRWVGCVAGEGRTNVTSSIFQVFSSVGRPLSFFLLFNHTRDKGRTDVPLVIPRMPQNWRDAIWGQFHDSHWERGIPDDSEELAAQPTGGVEEERSGSLRVRRGRGRKPSSGTHTREVLDACGLRHRLTSVEVRLTPTSRHGVCRRWLESTKYSKCSFHLPESLAAGTGPQDSLG